MSVIEAAPTLGLDTPTTPRLSERAMLVSLSMSTWAATKLDKEASRRAEDEAGAVHGSHRVTKKLLPQARQAYDDVRKAQTAAGKFVRENSLPWLAAGTRILTTEHYETVRDGGREHEQKIREALAVFLPLYPSLRDEARAGLGDNFKSTDYPHPDVMPTKFGFELRFMPFPEGSDFRVNLGTAEVRRLQAELRAAHQAVAAEAMNDVWTRLQDALAHMVEKLSEPGAVYRDTLFGNLGELCDVLPRLNLTADPELDRVASEIRTRITARVQPQEARDNPGVRAAVAEEAAAYLREIRDRPARRIYVTD